MVATGVRMRRCSEPAGDDVADFRIGQPLLRQELAIGLLAELAVQPLGARDLRDLGVDQPLGQMEIIFVGEGDQRALVDQRAEDRLEIAGDGRIIGLGPLPSRVLEPALHRLAHLALADLLGADPGQRRAAHPEADIAGAEVGDIADREAGERTDREDRHEGHAEFGFGQATEEGEHGDPAY